MGYGPVRFAPMLSIASGSITPAYTTLGTTTQPGRIVAFINVVLRANEKELDVIMNYLRANGLFDKLSDEIKMIILSRRAS